jgi:hypothetical protein
VEDKAVPQEPVGDPRLIEAIEACRPQSDDLSQPDLAFLAAELAGDAQLQETFERIQKTDVAIGRVLRDVPVPEGLADRLLVRLAEARQVEATKVLADTVLAETADRRLRRRSAMLGMAALAAAAAIFLAFLPNLRTRAFSLAEIQREVMARFQADLEQKPLGQPVSPSASLKAFPVSQDLIANLGVRWRAVSGLLGGKAIAYDLTLPDGTRATLYVVHPQSGLPPLPNSPPPTPTPMTQRRSIAVWQKATPNGNVLYVLAVDGEKSSYRRFLRVARMPVA